MLLFQPKYGNLTACQILGNSCVYIMYSRKYEAPSSGADACSAYLAFTTSDSRADTEWWVHSCNIFELWLQHCYCLYIYILYMLTSHMLTITLYCLYACTSQCESLLGRLTEIRQSINLTDIVPILPVILILGFQAWDSD